VLDLKISDRPGMLLQQRDSLRLNIGIRRRIEGGKSLRDFPVFRFAAGTFNITFQRMAGSGPATLPPAAPFRPVCE
jgi:hypothetical protein